VGTEGNVFERGKKPRPAKSGEEKRSNRRRLNRPAHNKISEAQKTDFPVEKRRGKRGNGQERTERVDREKSETIKPRQGPSTGSLLAKRGGGQRLEQRKTWCKGRRGVDGKKRKREPFLGHDDEKFKGGGSCQSKPLTQKLKAGSMAPWNKQQYSSLGGGISHVTGREAVYELTK